MSRRHSSADTSGAAEHPSDKLGAPTGELHFQDKQDAKDAEKYREQYRKEKGHEPTRRQIIAHEGGRHSHDNDPDRDTDSSEGEYKISGHVDIFH